MLRRQFIDRLNELNAWLATLDGFAGSELVPASSDASFRRYFRTRSGDESFILMDAPPPEEDCTAFVRVAGYLESMQLRAARVVAANIERGFLLLSDLGETQYLEKLRDDPSISDELYEGAMLALLKLQSRGSAYQNQLPRFDEKLLQFELSLFHDWLCGEHLGIEFSATEDAQWQDVCSLLVGNALDQPQVFVHRDYHSRNLMFSEDAGLGGLCNPGILDFQDAVEGPLTYDLVSLLKDCYLRWPAEQTLAWAAWFFDRLEPTLRDRIGSRQFACYFELMGVQRHLKAAGIFARLNHRDGKSGYLADIPRTLNYIAELVPRYSELEFLGELITTRCLPRLGSGT